MSLQIEKLKTVAPPDLNKYTCPVVKLTFIGQCPNISCPANISHRRTNKSGCFYEKKTTINSVINVARYLDVKTNEVKHRYDKGLKKIDIFTNFYNWITNNREVTKTKACPDCGVMSQSGHLCLNRKRCEQRKKLFKRVQQRFPFNVSALNVTATEFWILTNNTIAENFIMVKHLTKAKLLQNKINGAN